MNRYKVTFLQYHPQTGEPFVSHLFITAKSPSAAENKVKRLQGSLASPFGRKSSIKVLSTEPAGRLTDWILDMWWELDKTGFLYCWEPDLEESKMLKRLKEYNPTLFANLAGRVRWK